MVFSSAIFLFFFLPVVLAIYFVLPWRLKNMFLTAASIFFYAWGELAYVFVMLVSILFNYIFGLWIGREINSQQNRAKTVLFLAVSGNLILLAYYKYANFFVDSFNQLFLGLSLPAVELMPVHLPLGISFFTFHSISYLVDIYRKKAEAQRSLADMALYISMFPQLVAGPIIRYHDVSKQIISRYVNAELFASGIQRFIIGLAKKVLIANTLGEIADQIFALPAGEMSLSTAWLGIVCYTLQIYFDFSGYSDMAIGLARMFGFHFLENFNYPYISRSIQEFWRRWHISLSNWFRDYLYIPLGGNKVSAWRVYVNLWIVFLLCGFWHGASWNFVIWGALHGCYLIIERLGLIKLLDKLWTPLPQIYVMLLVMIGWVFFKADDLPHAIDYLSAMFIGGNGMPSYVASRYLDTKAILMLGCGVIAATPLASNFFYKFSEYAQRGSLTYLAYPMFCFARVFLLIALFYLCVLLIAAGTYNPFIYFRF
ncbi:MAG: MBOAT family protein [Gammaproteobacteria bacterium]|nr:MBOAT family protein [Gammaproteobacteria bacterium]